MLVFTRLTSFYFTGRGPNMFTKTGPWRLEWRSSSVLHRALISTTLNTFGTNWNTDSSVPCPTDALEPESTHINRQSFALTSGERNLFWKGDYYISKKWGHMGQTYGSDGPHTFSHIKHVFIVIIGHSTNPFLSGIDFTQSWAILEQGICHSNKKSVYSYCKSKQMKLNH